MNPIENPRVWYMAWNLALVTYVLLVIAAIFYWLGPIIVAKGLSRWEASQQLFRKTVEWQVPKGMIVTNELVQVLGTLPREDVRMN